MLVFKLVKFSSHENIYAQLVCIDLFPLYWF